MSKFDLDQPATHLLEGGICLGEESWDPAVVFRGMCGADGYFASCTFRDSEGIGGGATPREAMLSLAKNLRYLADRVENAAGGICVSRTYEDGVREGRAQAVKWLRAQDWVNYRQYALHFATNIEEALGK